MIQFKSGYKYQLTQIQHSLTHRNLPEVVDHMWVAIYVSISPALGSTISVRKHYAWDGPSGPTIDTDNFMRGSLIHDVLYQLMREGVIEESYRKTADKILRDICIEDGMSKLRAWWVYQGVRLGGKKSATKGNTKKVRTIL